MQSRGEAARTSDHLRVVFIGDIIGRSARRFLADVLPKIRYRIHADFVIANGENSAGGLGIIPKTAQEMFQAGVDLITSGNHVWDKREAIELLNENQLILRPANYPPSVPGSGFHCVTLNNHEKLLVINLQGRVFMEPVVDNPFLIVDRLLKENPQKCVFVDFHAEASAEKQAMGFFLDGRVSVVVGTHTHVQTSDIRILGNGTGYQTDVGMTGSLNSVIGMKRQPIIQRFLTGMYQRFEVARSNLCIDFSVFDIACRTGKCVHASTWRILQDEMDPGLERLSAAFEQPEKP
ncbi:MAG: TIGR00282 family metallophosphoesterase [Acidobacteriota bacterium]|jgi:metallophosphoesterase (TIGR00282 family)|nr:TIGR00282 family metallophosphoesterase [Acidobacteriota bacterium]